jgi:small subunit ribosomal protein S16
VGSKKNPIWRVVVADQRSPRDGRFIETIGHYNPQTEPSTIRIDEERLQHWLARGAQPTGTVKQLVRAQAKGLTPSATTATVAPRPPAPAEPEAAAEPADAELADAPETEAPAAEADAPEGEAEAPAAEADAPEGEAGPDSTE